MFGVQLAMFGSRNWSFAVGTGKKGFTASASDYLKQVLQPVVMVGLAFHDQKAYRASPGSQYVEDAAPWHVVKVALVEPKKIVGYSNS